MWKIQVNYFELVTVNVGYSSDIISIHYNEVQIGLALLPITLFTAIMHKCIRAIPSMTTKHDFCKQACQWCDKARYNMSMSRHHQ